MSSTSSSVNRQPPCALTLRILLQARHLARGMSAHIDTLMHRLKTGVSSVELLYVPHDRRPLSSLVHPSTPCDRKARLRISVLDSSFNPPTLAHSALSSVPMPPSIAADCTSSSRSADFDARLLLLSVRNADKALKPTDATYKQRAEMMELLAQDIITENTSPSGTAESDDDVQRSAEDSTLGNIAVGLIDEPTFVGKSHILREFIHQRLASLSGAASPSPAGPSAAPFMHVAQAQLTFVVGIDTLERILSPRYYASEEAMRTALHQFLSADGDDSYLICARRITPGLLVAEHEREEAVLRTAKEFIDPDRVTMVDIGEKIQEYSSSEVRQRIGSGQADTVWRRMVTDAIAKYIDEQRLYATHTTQTAASN